MKKNLFSPRFVEKSVFADERYLYPEFVPEKLPFRDREIEALAQCFEPVLRNRKPFNVFLAGPTGVGKTACAKHVLRELEGSFDGAKSLYLNCFEYNSRLAVLGAIANFSGAPVPRRGLATDEVFTRMSESLRKAGFTPIVVLDEVDQLLLSGDDAKLLYDLLRIVESERLRVGVVMISNDVSLTARLDPRIRSSLAEQAIMFEPYAPEQLKAILSERAGRAFANGALGRDVIGVAAAHAARLGGDARVAVESLLKAGRIAERRNSKIVALDDLHKAFEAVDSVSLVKSLKHLDRNALLLLRIIAENQPLTSGKIYELFAGKHGGALRERRVREILSLLDRRGIVSSRIVKGGSRGNTKEFAATIPRQFLLNELARLLGE